MSDDEMPPPLEDCSKLLQSKQSIHSPYIPKVNTDPVEEKKSKKKIGNSNSLKAGFLLNKNKKKNRKSQKRNKNKSKNRNKLQVNSKKNHLIIPEAQQKLNETQEAKMAKMTEKLHDNKELWNAMLSPKFAEAMNEISVNPQEALKKYQNDPSILPTLSKMVQTMYGQSLTSISKDVQSQIKKQNETNIDNSQLYDSLRLFNP